MHFNENSARLQAETREGHKQWHVKAPKARKGALTVCSHKTPMTFGKCSSITKKFKIICQNTEFKSPVKLYTKGIQFVCTTLHKTFWAALIRSVQRAKVHESEREQWLCNKALSSQVDGMLLDGWKQHHLDTRSLRWSLSTREGSVRRSYHGGRGLLSILPIIGQISLLRRGDGANQQPHHPLLHTYHYVVARE